MPSVPTRQQAFVQCIPSTQTEQRLRVRWLHARRTDITLDPTQLLHHVWYSNLRARWWSPVHCHDVTPLRNERHHLDLSQYVPRHSWPYSTNKSNLPATATATATDVLVLPLSASL